jgi:hypothetical protein
VEDGFDFWVEGVVDWAAAGGAFEELALGV